MCNIYDIFIYLLDFWIRIDALSQIYEKTLNSDNTVTAEKKKTV